MKQMRASEILDLLRSERFLAWYRKFCGLRQELKQARASRDELLAQAKLAAFKAEFTQQAADEKVFLAGEFEDRSAGAAAEFAEVENDSFESLSEFEAQRLRATEAWGEVGRIEQRLEELRQRSSDLHARMDAARKRATPESRAEADRFQERFAETEVEIQLAAKELEMARARYVREGQTKDRIWRQVEASWVESFQADMSRAEYDYQARRVQREAEQLFEKAGAERRRIDEVSGAADQFEKRYAQLESELSQHLEVARSQFDATLTHEFLYWPKRDDVQIVYCVPLIDELEHLNVQVSSLQLYAVARGKGIDFIEPMAEGTGRDDDPRLAAFFLEGRTLRRDSSGTTEAG